MAHRYLTCSHCGRTFDLDLFAQQRALVKRMRDEQLCFDCALWMNWKAQRKPDTHIISGHAYVFQIVREFKMHCTQNASFRFIHNISTNEIAGGCKYIDLGTIPQCIRDELPDEWKFIDRDTFLKMRGWYGTCCYAKGCWDRYHCFWYHPEITEPKGPWNKVPKSYKPGGEMCPSFINKKTMYNIKY